MKTFEEYLKEGELSDSDMQILSESLQTEWTQELEEKVNDAIESFVKQYANEDGSFDINRFDDEITNEGLLGSIFGGLGGFALGKTVGKMIAKVLGIKENSIMYSMLTSRLVGAALGAAIGNKI